MYQLTPPWSGTGTRKISVWAGPFGLKMSPPPPRPVNFCSGTNSGWRWLRSANRGVDFKAGRRPALIHPPRGCDTYQRDMVKGVTIDGHHPLYWIKRNIHDPHRLMPPAAGRSIMATGFNFGSKLTTADPTMGNLAFVVDPRLDKEHMAE